MATKMKAKGGEKKNANRNQPKPERLRRILANMPAAMLSAVQVRKNNISITLLVFAFERLPFHVVFSWVEVTDIATG